MHGEDSNSHGLRPIFSAMHAKTPPRPPDACAVPMATVSWSDVPVGGRGPVRLARRCREGGGRQSFIRAGSTRGMMVTPASSWCDRSAKAGWRRSSEHLALHTQVVEVHRERAEGTARKRRSASPARRHCGAGAKPARGCRPSTTASPPTAFPTSSAELLEGRDPAVHRLGRKGVTGPSWEIVAQLKRAPSTAHERGIVHRDIKPGNIFLCDSGGGDVFP